MNEQAAREVMLVRAIETTDRGFEILSEEDRRYASRSAKELAQWQAAHARTPVTADEFLRQRAGQILKRISERHPAFAAFNQLSGNLSLLLTLLPVAALLAGMLLDRITDPHRVDLLSAPLLLIIGWNLLVYLGMAVWPLLSWAGKKSPETLFPRLLQLGRPRLPRKLSPGLVAALTVFWVEWAQLSRPLALARLARAAHASAALFALGAALSLYARGYFSQYSAGWESTFLDAAQVHALLSALFTPAVLVLPLQGFSIADIEALRFGQTPSTLGGARWVHLYAATLLLLVVVPRSLLAGVAHWRARKWAANFPLDTEQPYFRKLLKTLGGAPGLLRVLPYSFMVDENRDKGLRTLATQLLGDEARLMLRPAISYGDEPREALRGVALNDGDATLTAVLFNLAATPENENHGALLDHLVRESSRGIAVLIDESGYLERAGTQAGSQARVADRRALWQQFCSFHKAPATFVNLLQPGVSAQDAEAGLALSGAR
ncbi:MAG: hypothetical protein JWR68_2860 [Polaromonas sp.]|nr:hypothetical protein [Polaromonas sp.]